MKTVWLAAAALLLAPTYAAPALAADTDQADADKADDSEKKICRASRATGSRVRVNRVCLTRAQWVKVEEDKKKSLEVLGRSGSVSPCGMGMQAAGCGNAPGPGGM